MIRLLVGGVFDRFIIVHKSKMLVLKCYNFKLLFLLLQIKRNIDNI
jgi:hypothetical protein